MIEIIPIQPQHYPQIAAIYLQGIATSNATFQTTATSWDEWNESHLPHSRLAAFEQNEMAGWVALSPVSSRCVYEGVAEVSIYISENYRGKGIGKRLLQKVIATSEANGLWTLQASVFPENIGSIKLHESCGFRQMGYREKIGKMHGVWRNNILLERRSKTVGIN